MTHSLSLVWCRLQVALQADEYRRWIEALEGLLDKYYKVMPAPPTAATDTLPSVPLHQGSMDRSSTLACPQTPPPPLLPPRSSTAWARQRRTSFRYASPRSRARWSLGSSASTGAAAASTTLCPRPAPRSTTSSRSSTRLGGGRCNLQVQPPGPEHAGRAALQRAGAWVVLSHKAGQLKELALQPRTLQPLL